MKLFSKELTAPIRIQKTQCGANMNSNVSPVTFDVVRASYHLIITDSTG